MDGLGDGRHAAARFAEIASAPAYRQVFEAVEREILAGRIPIGERLPTEAELSRRLGVHRTTTREGLRLLEQAGMAERRAGRRLYASAPGAGALSEGARRALTLGRVSFDGLWRLLRALEPAAAAAAAGRAAPGPLAALDDNLARTREAAASGASLTALDLEFHGLVAEAGGDAAWRLAREPAATLLFPANERMLPRLPQAGVRLLMAHEAIAAALRAGDAAAAEGWMRRHIDDFRRGYVLAGFDPDEPVAPAAT